MTKENKKQLDDMALFNIPVAHRGLWTDSITENSLEAFDNAMNKGYPIETDIRLTADGEVVIFHDSYMGRLTDKKSLIVDTPYSELKNLKLNGTDNKILLLQEALDYVHGKSALLIEIKNTTNNAQLCEKAIEIFKKYKGEFALQSFNPYIVKYVAQQAPEMVRGQLVAFSYGNGNGKMGFKEMMLKRLLAKYITHYFGSAVNPNFINFDSKTTSNGFIDRCKEENLQLLAWTIRNQDEEKKARKQANNIIFEKYEPNISRSL